MSPEQARGDDVDGRCDVYALGCCAYEMFCGRPPFVGKNAIDVLMHHVNDAPPALRSHNPDLPSALDDLICAMLAKDPAERPRLEEIEAKVAELARGARDAEVEIALEYTIEPDDAAPTVARGSAAGYSRLPTGPLDPLESFRIDSDEGSFDDASASADDIFGSPSESELQYSVV